MGKQMLVVLREIASEVRSGIYPLLGTLESRKIVGSGFGGDETKFIDEVAEEVIIRFLKRSRLSCTFIGEESGVQKIGLEPSFYLITDAVDGTTNVIRGINFVSTSLAVSPTDQLGGVEAAVVMNLADGNLYEAEKGEEARLNGKKIKPSEITVLKEAVLGIDASNAPDTVEGMIPLLKTIKSLRSFGSAALEICLVASGLLDAYVDIRGKLRIFDVSAAMLILKEAGGVFAQPDGKNYEDFSLTEMRRLSVIAAANDKILNEIVTLL